MVPQDEADVIEPVASSEIIEVNITEVKSEVHSEGEEEDSAGSSPSSAVASVSSGPEKWMVEYVNYLVPNNDMIESVSIFVQMLVLFYIKGRMTGLYHSSLYVIIQ